MQLFTLLTLEVTSALEHAKLLIREKEKSYVKKEYYHSSGN